MTRGGKWKLAVGAGCGLALLVVVGVLGVGTWYAGRMNQEYKEVRDSEKELLAATEGDQGFRPPAGGIPNTDRIEVFLAVRRDLADWLQTVATANRKMAADRDLQSNGGPKEFLRVVNTGSDLMPIYAGFWTVRNEALLARGMGPGEYSYIYRLVYHTWLQPDRPALTGGEYPGDALDDALDPYRNGLESVYHPGVDLMELIFQADRE